MHHLHGPLLFLLANFRWLAMAQMPPGKKVGRAGKASVLIVDDQPIVREYLGQVINNESDLHACGDAEGPAQAFELIDACRPEIIVTGLALKESHGLEFIKDLRARYPRLPVLVFSMYDESLYAERHSGRRERVCEQTRAYQ